MSALPVIPFTPVPVRRRALEEMLDALYGPKGDKGDSAKGGILPPKGS